MAYFKISFKKTNKAIILQFTCFPHALMTLYSFTSILRLSWEILWCSRFDFRGPDLCKQLLRAHLWFKGIANWNLENDKIGLYIKKQKNIGCFPNPFSHPRGNFRPTKYPITIPDKLFKVRKKVCDPLMPPKN